MCIFLVDQVGRTIGLVANLENSATNGIFVRSRPLNRT